MSIDNPATYGEAYWAPSVDANKAFADAEEKTLQPYLAQVLGMVDGIEGFPTVIVDMLRAVGTPGHFGLATVAKDTLARTGDASLMSGITPFLRSLGYAANAKFPSALIPFEAAVGLAHRRKILPELFESRAKAQGYKEAEARLLYDLASPYPDMMSLMQWARYTTDANETFAKVQTKMDIPDDEYAIWDFLTQLRLTTSDVQSLYLRGYMSDMEARTELRRNGYRDFDAEAMLDLAYTIPNASILIQDALLRGSSPTDTIKQITLAGIHPDFAENYLNAVLAKPDPTDIIRYTLRHDPNLGDLPQELRKIGVHPDYVHIFKELAFPVPPVQDMITMAVREAFSPDIAARFGQYEDYPSDLTRYAAMNGISEDWAKRYWAAHWSLPSPQQGFEMFQRGIVTRDELHLLLRALDIMPFWRDRLIQVAYRPLTRVDVRRMYNIGVLTEPEVEKAYRDAGYSEENARRLRDFVVRDSIRSQSGMSVSKIVTAYKNGLTTRSEAYNAVATLGVRPQNISDILEAADKQLQWQRTKDAIAAIQNQYKQEFISEEQARGQLASLRLDGDKINTLIARWQQDGEEQHKTLLTKADVLTMLVRGILGESRARTELSLLGYNQERSNALIANATYTK